MFLHKCLLKRAKWLQKKKFIKLESDKLFRRFFFMGIHSNEENLKQNQEIHDLIPFHLVVCWLLKYLTTK